MIRLALACMLGLAAVAAEAEIKIQEITSPGGIDAWLVEEHSIPFVAIELRFKGGASLDLPGKRGATNLMVGLLEEGTGEMDARDFARAAEELAASFDYDVYDDSIAISARMLTENRDEAVELFRKSIVEPRFDQESIDRVRGQVESNIRSELTDPNDIAGAAFDALAFGDHPYATDSDGTLDSVAALTRDDIVAAHQGAIARDRVYASAVGDITAEELGLILDRLVEGLPETGLPQPGPAPVNLDGGIHVVPYDVPQSVAIFGHEGFERDDPDFFAAYILNVILGGGGFESRLMDEVREKRGLTYGVGSYLVPKDHAALYLGQVASANNRIAQAIEVIQNEWVRMRQEGVTEDELARAKTYLTGGYPLRFDGNGTIANILVGMQMEGLSPDYVVTRNAKIEAVTREDVLRVAQRLMRPDELTFVVVGQPEGLEDAIPIQ
ncbi:M16 family metallopeptidase [Pseudaestuariivita atlantica]|uniref:Zinc protease n=1 Tax=Pseudaestuariivita atlantica TaxID=1317121 RepID=A0A0L1JSY8_9RHOB|nr:pitrilysin family protein [Pseudaestuariivita atlantica]KNG94865.1 zinc protease [Pseudaestuariivita atlantica]